MMANLRIPTDDDGLLEKIIAEIELLEQQPEQISDIASLASLFVHLSRCNNVYLQEMVARLATECFASKNQMKQQHEMILQLQKQLGTITDIHQIDSQTTEGQQLHRTQGQLEPTVKASSPMNIVTAEIKTGREQQLQEEQTVQESNQSQTEINEIDVGMTDDEFLLSDSDQMDEDEEIDIEQSIKEINQRNGISTQTDEQSRGIENLPKECDKERSRIMTRSNNVPLAYNYESDEDDNFSQSLWMTQAVTTELHSGAGSLTDDGLPNKITEIERTDQQPEQFNDAGQNGNLNKMAVIPTISENTVEFTGEVQNLHQTQEENDLTVEASSRMEVDISDTVMNESQHFSSQMEQQQEIVSVRDVSSTVQIDERSDSLLRSGDRVQIAEMVSTNNRLPLDDSIQMEPLSESENVQLTTEERSEGSGITLLPNVSIDVEQRYEQEGTMPSLQMKMRFVRLRTVNAKQIASNSERSKTPPENLQNTRKKSTAHSCGECNKPFISKSLLITHSRVHTGEKPFACTDCGAAFSQSTNLKNHQRIHSGEKPFTCTDCGAAFSQSTNLKSHQRIHSGERPFVCTDCGAAFRQSADCKKHQRIHSDEKPFICDICKKAFRLKRELLLHMGIHSGKKSHKCNVCTKEFIHKNTLKKHRQLHSK